MKLFLIFVCDMADTMTPQQRSLCMAAIKGKNTKPEMIVRRFLFAKGLRYRVNNRKLPGSPDIVLKKYRTVVFVDGCFWHGHEGCKYFRLPKSNTDFWRQKIALNYARDYANNIHLRLAGWRVIRIWECEIRTKERKEEVLRDLYERIIHGNIAEKKYAEVATETPAAAEPESSYNNKN